ncbi:MFS transporter [Rugosimonospora africana]|uniref:MFS transporter n=1 Tax=Rugosimonospora africana TaxID=556532 RepID=A0A8J3VQQ1_9ACTN|nr:MFS transporter [Rugosimonospora africana]GIH15354.1 MFS transporter [Rugosimonospora africana]
MTTADPVTLSPVPDSRGRPRTGLALLGVSLGYFMVLLDMTVLSVAEPDLARSLGSSLSGLQWAVTGYTAVFGALLLSAGAVADRYGAHRVFRLGIGAFGLGSLLCALAPDIATLVVLRGLLGVAAAASVPASLALIAALYPEPAARARAVATWAAVSGAALAAGPIAGGVLVDVAGWRAIFLINVPLAGVTLALTATRAVRGARGQRTIDWAAQLAACAALGLLTDALIAVGSGSVAHAAVSAAATVAAGVLFAALQRRARKRGRAPVIPAAVVRSPGMRPALLAAAAVNFAMSGILFVLPLLFQRVLRLSPVEVGLAFLPMTLPFAVNPPLTGRLVARIGPWRPMLAGLGLLAVGGLALAAAVLAGDGYPAMVAGLVCTGCGVSLALPALATAVVATAPAGSAGAAGGLLNAVRQVGATLGVAVLGAVAGTGAAGTAAALALAAAGCVAAACVAAVLGLGRRAGRSAR